MKKSNRYYISAINIITVKDFTDELQKYNPDAYVRFSIADDESEDDSERWFCEDGIEDVFGNSKPQTLDHDIEDEIEVTICLVGKSNLI